MIFNLSTDNQVLSVQFDYTPRVSSLNNTCFSLALNTATPVPIGNAFQPLDLTKDYDSIGRRVFLRFITPIVPGNSYTLTVSGVISAAGQAIPTDSWTFQAPSTNISTFTADQLPPNPQPVDVEDRSIFRDIFTNAQTLDQINPNFYILDMDPDPAEPFVDAAYNNGRVTITFSTYPAGRYINSTYFRVQAKVVVDEPTASYAKWQNVNCQYSTDTVNPVVYIDFPSIDATPVYHQPGHTYYQSGLKYRIKISKQIGTA